MWVLITFVAYVLVNVSIKTIVSLLHLDGSLPMKNGKVIADETELIHNQGTSAHPRYFSYGKVRPIPGYKRETESFLADSNETDFLFRREEGTQGPDQIYFAVTTKEAETAAEEARERMLGFYQNAEAQMLEKCRGTAGEYIKFTYTESPLRNHQNIRKPTCERPVWYYTSARKSVKNPAKACTGVRTDVQEGDSAGIRGLCFSVRGTGPGE